MSFSKLLNNIIINLCVEEIQNNTSPSIGSKNCGKTTIIRRYIANQFIAGNEDSQSESQKILQAAQLFTHTLKVPGRHEVVSITFWEIPSNPLEYMKKQYYSGADAALIGGC